MKESQQTQDFKLRDVRNAKHISRKKLAELSGVHEQTINFLENNVNDPREAKISTLIKLASALHCKVRDFYPCEKNI